MAGGSPIARLFVRLGMDKGEFDRGSRDAKTQTRDLRQSLGGVADSANRMSTALQAAGLLGIAYMAKRAGEAVLDVGRLGAQALRTEASFEDLATRIGATSTELMTTLRTVHDHPGIVGFKIGGQPRYGTE